MKSNIYIKHPSYNSIDADMEQLWKPEDNELGGGSSLHIGRTDMRILNLANFNVFDFGYGKGRVSTYLPLMGFVKKGYDVWWLTSIQETEDNDDERLEADGIKVVRFDVPYFRILSRLNSIAFVLYSFITGYKLARRIKPDIIFAHQPINAIPAFLLSRIFRIPYIVKVYGHPPEYFGGKIGVKLPANFYIVVNDGSSADKALLTLGVLQEKIAFLVNGIDKELPQKADTSLRLKLAPNDEKIVLFIGWLHPTDQPELLIKMVPPVIKEHPNTLFVIVGDGPEKKNLENLCHELGISEYIKFTGAVPHSEMASYLYASELLITLTYGGNISNSVIEAMCCGRAVIALNAGTTSDLVKHGETGFLLEKDEIEKLPSYILKLLNNDSLRESMSKKAREFILKNWLSWEERVAIEVDLAENLVKRHRKRRK